MMVERFYELAARLPAIGLVGAGRRDSADDGKGSIETPAAIALHADAVFLGGDGTITAPHQKRH